MSAFIVTYGRIFLLGILTSWVLETLFHAQDCSCPRKDAPVILQQDAKVNEACTEKEVSEFDAIVNTAYDLALSPVVMNRPKFDIDYWEKESNLTTHGGLSRMDRIKMADYYYKAESVFEFGLGESTYLANYMGVQRYAGIDSDPVWVSMTRENVSNHFRFYFGDVGLTGAWGFPYETSLPKSILNYQLAAFIVEPKPFDVYLVDGRWRLPSLVASFLHASARGAPHHHTIGLLHDCRPRGPKYEDDRPKYKLADHLLEVVDHSGSRLCVYKRRAETTDKQLVEIWHKYMNQVAR
jgi:hypothetical protein